MDTPRLLLVDDEPAITENLAPFLQRAGFEVTVAADGEEALREAARVRPDLIVLDVLMPRLDGREALRSLRRAGDWTPVILLTHFKLIGLLVVLAFSLPLTACGTLEVGVEQPPTPDASAATAAALWLAEAETWDLLRAVDDAWPVAWLK